MTHYYVAQSLDRPNSPVKPIQEILHQSATRVLVLPARIIQEVATWTQSERHERLANLIDEREANAIDLEKMHEWHLQEGAYTAFDHDDPNTVKKIVALICIESQKAVSPDNILFVTGSVFRPLYDLANLSHINIAPYLIWDQGNPGVWPKKLNTKKGEKLLWSGAGSCSLDQRRWQSNPHNPKNHWRQDSYEAIRPTLNERATALVEAHDALADKKPHDARMQPNLRVAHRLLRYLPPKQDKKTGKKRSYGYDAVAGLMPLHGPIPWRGWRDELFDDLERDLIFESWLVPFKGATTGQWFLQPGSLLMLYWAFDVVGMQPGMPADGFIQQHYWKDWFGERIPAYAS